MRALEARAVTPRWSPKQTRYGEAFKATLAMAPWDPATDSLQVHGQDEWYGKMLKRWRFAPALKALWGGEALSDAAVLAWADAPATTAAARRARKFAAPFCDWLRTAEVVAEEPATEGTGAAVEVA